MNNKVCGVFSVVLFACSSVYSGSDHPKLPVDEVVLRLNALRKEDSSSAHDWSSFAEIVQSALHLGTEQIKQGSAKGERDIVNNDFRIGGEHYKTARELFKRLEVLFTRFDKSETAERSAVYRKCRNDFYRIYGWFEFKTSIKKRDGLQALKLIIEIP